MNTPQISSSEPFRLLEKLKTEQEKSFTPLSVQNYQIHSIESLGSFYLDSENDLIKSYLKQGKVWEPKIQKLMPNYIREGSIAIDVGAHIGVHTLLLSQYAHRVYAFEPQKKLYSELVMNLKLNKKNNVISYPTALGDTFSSVELCMSSKENEGSTTIGKGSEKSLMIPLDGLNLENVSLIKIDVENSELKVLEGAYFTLIKNRPAIFIEICGNLSIPVEDRNQTIVETIDWLIDLGYIVQKIAGFDYLALPEEQCCKELGFSLSLSKINFPSDSSIKTN